MVDGPGYRRQSVLDSFLFDGGPQSPSTHARGALLRIDDGIVEVAKEIDDNTVFGGRGASGAVAATANPNLEVVRPGVLQRERDVIRVFYEGYDASGTLCIDCPPGYRLGIASIVGGHDVPFERLLERGESRHPWQKESTRYSARRAEPYILTLMRASDRRNIRSFREPDRALGVNTKDGGLGLVVNLHNMPMGWPENWHANPRLWVDMDIVLDLV